MGEAWHHPVCPRLGLGQEGAHQPRQPGAGLVALVAHPQAKVDCHLVVPAARGVQEFARLAHQFGQPRFHVQVDIFQFHPKGEAARFNL